MIGKNKYPVIGGQQTLNQNISLIVNFFNLLKLSQASDKSDIYESFNRL